MKVKKIMAIAISLGLIAGTTTVPTFAADKKTFVFGDTTFNAENEEADMYPLWRRRNFVSLFRYHGNRAMGGKGV